ncbi:MAG: malate dehydrogenase [Thaumarchaeota archaeon]|nr:malate dehydrogenase [Nitrososphaerota archaeon]
MITIVGSGKVGGAAALFTALRKVTDEILLLDVVQGLPQGEAMDLNHMLSEKGIDVNIRGSNDYSEMKGSDIVVVVAGSGRKPGMTRMDLLKINASIVKGVVENVKKFAKDAMILPVTNPLDPMAYLTYKVSGFEKNRVFGMGNMLDLSRFVQFIHESTGFSRSSIRALVIGEHGENMLPLPRFSTVSGVPLSSLLSKEKAEEIVQGTRQVAAKVIELKGATVHAPGNAISAIVESVMRDKKQVIPVATYLEGEYGHSGVSIGVPAVLGRNGVEKIIELDLDSSEREWFAKGVASVKAAISGLEI